MDIPAAPKPVTPLDQTLRLECLKLACVFDPDIGWGDALNIASKFAAFVIEDKLPSTNINDDDDDDLPIAGRRFGTMAFDEDGGEVE